MDRYAPGAVGVDGEAVGAAMRLARRRVGLSQRGLAAALGWSRAKVGRWENGTVPQGFDEVVSILRVLGFEVTLRDPAAAQWAESDDPAEHVLDRGDRRFPAHLQLCEERTSATWNWTRHRGEPSPNAAGTSFRRNTQVQALAAQRSLRASARVGPDSGQASRESEPAAAAVPGTESASELPSGPEPMPASWSPSSSASVAVSVPGTSQQPTPEAS